MPLSRDEVITAYRLFLDRDPLSEAEITAQSTRLGSLGAIRAEFIQSSEFQAIYAAANPRKRTYGVQSFLLGEDALKLLRDKSPNLCKRDLTPACSEAFVAG